MKKKFLSFLLAATLVTGAVAPTTPSVVAQGSPEPFAYVEPADGLVIESDVMSKGDGSYHVTLDSYVTSAHTPLDVVLVLDTSNNMDENFGSGSRLQAMKSAAKDLIHKLADSYTTVSHHHVGIVAYSDTATNVTPTLTKVDNSTVENNLCAAIDGLQVDNSRQRRIDRAMVETSSLLVGGYDDGETHPNAHQRVVILLSSGKPKNDSFDFTAEIADRAIEASQAIKQQQGALVYSIGIFEEANPNELWGADDYRLTAINIRHSSDGSVGSHWCGSKKDQHGEFARDIPANNRFFNYLSSNSPDAAGLGLTPDYCLSGGANGWWIRQNYTCDTSLGYYQAATNPEALSNVFNSILDKTLESHIQLDASAVLKETVSPYFDIVSGTVKTTVVASTGKGEFEGGQETAVSVADVSGNEISVTGFDYNVNCVTPNVKGDGTYGSKLVLEFDVTPKTGFIGGNGVPICGGGDSGMYQGGTTNVGSLPEKTVDIAIKQYAVEATNQKIFLGETADLDERLVIPETVNGVNNAFVTITYTLKTGGQLVGTYTIPAGKTSGDWNWENGQSANAALTETTTYDVSCTVTPTAQGDVGTFTAESAKFTVTVESGKLTITRTNGTANEPYVLNIMKDDNFYMTVTVDNGTSVTLTKLPIGNYTVAEDNNWTWRYGNSTSQPESVTIGTERPNGNLTVSAEKINNKWLNDYDKGGVQ